MVTSGLEQGTMAREKTNESIDTFPPFPNSKIPIRQRIKHFTWAWFTLTMSTGGISSLLAAQPHTFPGLRTIGKITFIFFLVLLVFNITLIITRFCTLRKSLQKSLTHPTESLFFSTLWLSLAVLLNNVQVYGVPECGTWLVRVLRVLFWVYAGCTFIVGVGQYFLLFTAGTHMTIHSMTPAWILPVFPAMLTGTVASVLAPSQPPEARLPMLVAGLTFQGLGFLISLVMMALYLYRLMIDGLPAPSLRPGMFMAVGPPSFTSLALIGLAKSVPRGYAYFERNALAADILQTMALAFSIFLWAFAAFFFGISSVACVSGAREMRFSLIFWAFVFPNTGFTIATIVIGNELGSEGIRWVGSVMSILLVAAWLANLVFLVRAVALRKMLWPGRDEDRDELRSVKSRGD